VRVHRGRAGGRHRCGWLCLVRTALGLGLALILVLALVM
jgi:hypothetical protein